LYAQWEEVFPRISAGDNFSVLITKEGKLYAAGANGNGRLGDGTTTERREFTAVNEANIKEPVEWVSSGQDHSFAILKNGGVVGWGRGDMGKLGLDRDDGDSPVPAVPAFSGTIGMSALGEVAYVSAGRYQTALLNKKGEYWAAGSRNSGALGNGGSNPGNREKQFKLIQTDVVSIAAGQNYIMLVKKDGSLWIAGDGSNGRLGTGSYDSVTTLRRNIALGFENKAVFTGKNNHSMVIMGSNNAVLSTGNNSAGQLGHGGTTATNYFRAVVNAEGTELSDVSFVSLGNEHSMILKNDGSLWAVGRNNDTQLGITPSVNQNKAVKVLENVAYVAAGYNHTLAVKEDGSLWAAGSNYNGQFGQKTSSRNNNLWTRIDISAILSPPPVAPVTP
jgi:alpha-tubulin suppressor-like RCC1 family protein